MQNVQELFSFGTSVNYEWDEFHVYRHPLQPRKYVVDADSGCSCDGYEVPSLESLGSETPMGKREVYKAFLDWWPEHKVDRYDGTKIDNLERLRSSL